MPTTTTPAPNPAGDRPHWDSRYEWRAIALLTVAFGLVGLDRFIINPLFPSIMKDLGLDYQDLGNTAAALALTWGLAALLMGRVADRIGHRRVILPAVIAFSLLAGLTGLVTGVMSLLLVRAIMGVAEGAFVPASIAETIGASHPTHRGRNFGFQQNGLPLIGLGLGPILATQLLNILPSWRWVFVIVSLPGFVVAYLLYRVLRKQTERQSATENDAIQGRRWLSALRHRNVALGTLLMMCVASALNIVIAMTPSYVVDHLGLGTSEMGFVVSAIGFGAFCGGLIFPALSDRFGRKPTMLACAVLGTICVWRFSSSTADPATLFLWLLLLSTFAFSVIYITIGPLALESVPPFLAATAVGIIVGVGEIVGGAFAPASAGYIAKNLGIERVFELALGAMVLSVGVLIGIKEPRTRSSIQREK